MQERANVVAEVIPLLAGGLAQTQIDDPERAIGQIIMAAQRMDNALASALRLPTLQRADLRDEATIIEQAHQPAVEVAHRRQINVRYDFLAFLVCDVVPLEGGGHPTGGVVVANDFVDAVAGENGANLARDDVGIEWRPRLVSQVEHGHLDITGLLQMADGHGERVAAPGSGVAKRHIVFALDIWPLVATRIDGTPDNLGVETRASVISKFSVIFGISAGGGLHLVQLTCQTYGANWIAQVLMRVELDCQCVLICSGRSTA
ncbi:MAG: hypothetical protein WA733_11605 [Methylocystis sp.]